MTTKIFPPKGEGKGWGDGKLVREFNARRKRNAENTYTGFRPRTGDNEGAYFVIRNWCEDERINKSFSALFNSLMIGLKEAVINTTEVNEETGEISIELNLGRIPIK